ADGSTRYTYLDREKGLVDEIYWWYVVRAVGLNGLGEMNKNAVYEPGIPWYTLNITVEGNGTIIKDPDCSTYIFDTPVKLKPLADHGWRFDDWKGPDTTNLIDLDDGNYTITINTNKTLTAVFTLKGPYTLNLTTSGMGQGLIQVSPSEPYYYGTIVTIWANASIGSYFTGFTGEITHNSSPQTVMIVDNMSVDAGFDHQCYDLTITISGNGSVTKDPDQPCYIYDTMVLLTPTGDSGWSFHHWDGDLTADSIPETIMMNENKQITAVFTHSPLALFTYTPNEPKTSDMILFNSTSYDPDGFLTNWTWDMGDTTIYYGEQVTHQYIHPGSYEVQLTVTDDANTTYVISQIITITLQNSDKKGKTSGHTTTINDGSGSNQVPTATAEVDRITGTPSDIFTFNASESYDSDGQIRIYTWDFDDGTISTTDETTITHLFPSVGTYHIMLSVEDDQGATDDLDEPITIEIIRPNTPPKNLFVETENTWVHKNMDVTFTMSATDPDENDTVYFAIDWDDDTTLVSAPVRSNERFNISHRWDTYGIYEMTVTVYDKQYASAQPITIIIYVDVFVLEDELQGLFIDTDSDGSYDMFTNTETGEHTPLYKQNDTTYIIESIDEGTWLYSFDTETLQAYVATHHATPDIDTSLIVLMILPLLILISLIITYRHHMRKREEK
ncbi:MAG: PKD domain-containing protein, partial [Candidatus Thermoplasmatota archaeon]|nr:PKD domain-containing protein [Candidatus Thermoplasmatota archaeon]